MIRKEKMLKKKNLFLEIMLIMLLAFSTSLMAAPQEVSNLNDFGGGSLRQAIIDVGAGEEITFSVTGTITLTSGHLAIDKNLTITGPGTDQLSIDGDASSRIFQIGTSSTNPTITITGLTMTNGNADYGGGIFNYSDNLTLENCTISGNSVSDWGGGMYNDGCFDSSSPTLTNCTISGNSAFNDGGGMYNLGYVGTSSPTLTNCTISGNSAFNDGGGMYNLGYEGTSSPTLTNCILWNDNAGSGGNEVFNDSATPSYSYCDVEGCGGSGSWVSSFGTNNGNNIDSDPLFHSEPDPASAPQVVANHDLLLNNGSPCLGTGSVPGSAPSTDIDGRSRPLPAGASNVDMGAFEQYNDGTLPVELSTFTAQFIENIPTLYWSTQSETDNMGWFVYRNEENDFTTSEKISEFIEGNGTTSQQQSYIYEDSIENPKVGDIYYYWLESIDYSGLIHHYDRVAIMHIMEIGSQNPPITVPPKYGLQTGPNPFSSDLTVSYMLPKTDLVRVEIYNIHGQLVAEFDEGQSTADINHKLKWNGKDLYGKDVSSGVLLIKLITTEDVKTKKAILLR